MNLFRNRQLSAEQEEQWSLERDRYMVLLHYYHARETAGLGALSLDNVIQDLGFSERRANSLIESLLDIDFVRHALSPLALRITDFGVGYIERERGRRCSLRLPVGDRRSLLPT